MLKTILFVALLLLAGVLSAQQYAGTYTTTIGDGDVPPDQKAAVGMWEVMLGDENEFTASQNGDVKVRGTYAISGDQMSFSDSDGEFACAKDQASGTYQPTLNEGTLTFKVVDDKCSGRRIILTSHPLVKKKNQ
jgi:hypothetical protein